MQRLLFALGNPFVRWILRSPLHGLISRHVMIVSYRGKKSGRLYHTPVEYFREGDAILFGSEKHHRRWWKNVGGHAVTLRVQGRDLAGRAECLDLTEAEVRAMLDEYYAFLPAETRVHGPGAGDDSRRLPRLLTSPAAYPS